MSKDTIYLCQTQQLKHLNKQEYIILRDLCHTAKKLYNVGLYNIRQYFFQSGKFLNYENNYTLCKTNENYKILNSNMAQQILKEVDGAFKSFFGLLRLAKARKYNFDDVKIPKYLNNEAYYTLVIGQIRIKPNGILDIPMSPFYKKLYGKLSIKIPSNLQEKRIKIIRIIPKSNARFFEIQYTYEEEVSQRKLNKSNVLAIDLGLDNLCTCVTNEGKSFIIDGKRLKSLNQWFNKTNARLQSIKDKQKFSGTTKQQASLWNRRNNCIRYYINKSVKIIINFCLDNDIGTLVIGYNPSIQKNIHMGKANNQNFVNIPIGSIKEKLEYLCKRYGLQFYKQEESYTSKADFFMNDRMPVYDIGNLQEHTFSGKRITRGQYRSAAGMIINADQNGALNIMLKSNLGGEKLDLLQDRGNLEVPMRIRIV